MIDGWHSGPVAGVIGGLGPLATAQFLAAVVEQTGAETDQDNLDMLISQHSSTPDRTAYLLDDSMPDPTPALIHDARMLERMGADFLVIPCNTAHAFIWEIRASVNIAIVDMLEATVDDLNSRVHVPAKVGLLATDGTRRSGIYQEALTKAGHDVILPDEADQDKVMFVIYEQVKGGSADQPDALLEVIKNLRDAGAEYLILGCTELPIAAKDLGVLRKPWIVDSLESLAKATLRQAGR